MLHYRAYILDAHHRIAQPANEIEAATDEDQSRLQKNVSMTAT